jgi:hypothetical protein
LFGKSEKNKPFEKPRCRWENNIKKVSSRNGMKSILYLCVSGQGQVLGSRECSSELSGSIRHAEFID